MKINILESEAYPVYGFSRDDEFGGVGAEVNVFVYWLLTLVEQLSIWQHRVLYKLHRKEEKKWEDRNKIRRDVEWAEKFGDLDEHWDVPQD